MGKGIRVNQSKKKVKNVRTGSIGGTNDRPWTKPNTRQSGKTRVGKRNAR